MKRAVLPEGFGYLDQYIPNIEHSIGYATPFNFTGHIINSYKSYTPLEINCIHALQKAQSLAEEQGYSLVIYEGYRPKRVKDEVAQLLSDQNKLIKEKLLNYFPENSLYSTGFAVSVSLIDKNKRLKTPTFFTRRLGNKTFCSKDDNSLDMLTSFDTMDSLSFIDNEEVPFILTQKRKFLEQIMKSSGFIRYQPFWWSFVLEDHKKEYHDFVY